MMGRTDPKRSEGARLERKVMQAYLRRLLKKKWPGTLVTPDLPFKKVLNWVITRQKRYDRRPGGL